MIEFLNRLNISKETIDYLDKNLSANDKMSLEDNEEECIKTLILFKTLGINNYEELLKYETYIFYKPTDTIYYELNKENLEDAIRKINDDYSIIEEYI